MSKITNDGLAQDSCIHMAIAGVKRVN